MRSHLAHGIQLRFRWRQYGVGSFDCKDCVRYGDQDVPTVLGLLVPVLVVSHEVQRRNDGIFCTEMLAADPRDRSLDLSFAAPGRAQNGCQPTEKWQINFHASCRSRRDGAIPRSLGCFVMLHFSRLAAPIPGLGNQQLLSWACKKSR